MGSWIVEATEADFNQQVLERSKVTPVLVDFWAEWCGPCRMLTPLLEETIAAHEGAVYLAKVNVDQNPQLAAQFGIRSIPAVKAFWSERLVGEFIGLRERRDIEAFIDQIKPSPGEESLKKATEFLRENRAEEALAALQQALNSHLHRDTALLMSARIYIARHEFIQAQTALKGIDASSSAATDAQNLQVQIELMESGLLEHESTLQARLVHNPSDVAARWALAGKLLIQARIEESLNQLLELVQCDRTYRDDGARRAMLSIFATIGQDDELTREYRRRLQIYV